MTDEQRNNIAINVNNATAAYDYYELMNIAKSNEFAMYYIITKLLESNEKLEHIKNILK